MNQRKKRITWTVVGLAAAALVVLALRPRGLEIEALHPWRGAIRESFREPARTRLENTWKIAMPVGGRIGRIQLEPGDRVTKGQVLAEFDLVPFDTAIEEGEATIKRLEATLEVMDDNSVEQSSLSEAEAMATGSEKSVQSAESRVKTAQSRLEHAERELKRMEELAAVKSAAQSQLDDARLAADTARLELSRSETDLAGERSRSRASKITPDRFRNMIKKVKVERKEILAQIEQTKAALDRTRHDRELAKVVSPIEGIVLERTERGERPLLAGAELMLLGSPADIEVIADILTQDALRLKLGGDVEMDSATDGLRLKGRVKRIEPQGFTKLSSLGVEQQRVNVIVTVEGGAPPTLGVGFRLYARFYTGEKTDALLVPRFAVLQAPDQSYYVDRIEGGRLRRRTVTIGLRSDMEMEVTDGLTESDLVVAAPDSTLTEGLAVKPVIKAKK